MKADFRSLLLADATVAAIATGGITWQRATQAPTGSAAYAVLTLISGRIGMHHAGRDGLDTARVQIDCFAPSLEVANALREAIHDRACGFQGTQGSTEFTAILPNAPRDFPPVNSIHRCVSDLSVTYRSA